VRGYQTTKNIRGPAGRKSDDDANRPRRVIERRRGARKDYEAGGGRRGLQKGSAVNSHHHSLARVVIA
jgi:hypothetical protein